MRIWLVIVMLAGLAAPARAAPRCDEACLSAILDRYLAAMVAHDTQAAPLAADIRFSENDVMLQPGDGLWTTIDGIEPRKELRFFDPVKGEIGYLGVVTEHGLGSYLMARMTVRNGRIAEVESLVHRKEPGPGIDPKLYEADPEVARVLAPEERTPRAKMIALADGYFSTLQLNDGTMHTSFDPDCQRAENGMLTAGKPSAAQPKLTGCAHQLEMGELKRITAARGRAFFAVDESRGLIMARIFLDHDGFLSEYKRTDGTTMSAAPHTVPQTWCALELFKIVNGRIRRIHATMTGVPYKLPTPWAPAPVVARGAFTPASAIFLEQGAKR